MYKLYSVGDKTEPCGSPFEVEVEVEVTLRQSVSIVLVSSPLWDL
jgi:hypothetical protein